MSEENPYSPPNHVASEAEPKITGSSKIIGSLCVFISLLALIPGVIKFLSSLLVFGVSLNGSNSVSTAQAIGGVFGAGMIVILGGWLFNFGMSKIKGRNKRA